MGSMKIDDVIRWLDIQISMIKEDIERYDDSDIKEAQTRALLVSKVSLKSLLCWKEFNPSEEDKDTVKKLIEQIEAEGESV